MDVFAAVKSYFSKMFRLPNSGMKIMIVDEETLGILSISLAFSEIMSQEVFLVDRIKSSREPLKHLTAIFFIRPTADNISLLVQELRSPRYASYYIFFSHALSKQALKHLAESDVYEVVSEVHEFFADFLAISPHLYCIDRPLSFSVRLGLRPEVLTRSTLAITSVLLALQLHPLIRYQNSSDACRSLAESVRSFISREAVLFDFRRSESSPTLLILDRRQDPITPLLTQWTYEAMIHELIGIKNNRVAFSPENTSETPTEITLSRDYDDFFRNNQYKNFGEIGQSIKMLVESFQNATKAVDVGGVSSLNDLKGLLENYPAFRKASGAVETHVTLVSELSRLVKNRSLMELSEIEQELVCQDNHSASFPRVKSVVSDSKFRDADALRLVLLYALRFESHRKEIATLSSLLLERGLSREDVSLTEKIITYAGTQQRIGSFDLFSAVKQAGLQTVNPSVTNATNTVTSLTKRFVKGRKGVENIYTQHEPLVIDILRELIRGQLKESSFPLLECANGFSSCPQSSSTKNVIVFIIGGATYEESFALQKLMKSAPGVTILLGSSFIHNSESFLREVRAATADPDTGDFDPDSSNRNTRGNLPVTLGFAKAPKHTHYSLLR
ncbi:unnamed protein product [Schistocephalus solidus]|uniref:Vacuolar protein sorting-associated protein 45 n=1 Tax=Schistocephalus solidus TaxID=70667 RepID=A0A0X3NQ14_SCHSO|nr:unnamed protein product [Schistocephalus solidus]